MINKNKNVLIQITLSKADAERLTAISEQLSTLLSIDLNKSQTIAFLIKNYGKSPLNNDIDVIAKPNKTTAKSGINYQAQTKALKDKLSVSYPKLAEIIGIPETTLKKYASGKQNPSGQNLELFKKALKDYGIK